MNAIRSYAKKLVRALVAISLVLAPDLTFAQTPGTLSGPSTGGSTVTVPNINAALAGKLDYTNYCASVINTGSDAAACISATLSAAAGGGIPAHFYPGVYTILSAVTVPSDGLELIGSGWDETNTTIGTVFKIGATGFVPFALNSTLHFVVRDIAFEEPQPTPSGTYPTAWTPTAYGPIFTVGVLGTSFASAEFDNILFNGVTAGIQVNTGGRVTLAGVKGQVFSYLLDCERCTDVTRVDHIHVWPYWSQNSNVYAYQLANADIILSNRNDDPKFNDIFGYAMRSAINIGSNAQGTTGQAMFSNIDCNFCANEMLISGSSSGGQVTNMEGISTNPITGTSVYPGGSGVTISGNNTNWGFTNLFTSDTDYSGVNVTGSGNIVRLVNLNIDIWAGDGPSPNGINPGTGNTITLCGFTFQHNLTYTTPYTPGSILSCDGLTPYVVGSFTIFDTLGGFIAYVDANGHFHAPAVNKTAPTVSSCGTGASLAAGSSDTRGTINVGSGTNTACTLNFGSSFVNGPNSTASCTFTALGVSSTITETSISSTAVILAMSPGITSKYIQYHCLD